MNSYRDSHYYDTGGRYHYWEGKREHDCAVCKQPDLSFFKLGCGHISCTFCHRKLRGSDNLFRGAFIWHVQCPVCKSWSPEHRVTRVDRFGVPVISSIQAEERKEKQRQKKEQDFQRLNANWMKVQGENASAGTYSLDPC